MSRGSREINTTDLKARRHDADQSHARRVESSDCAEDSGVAIEEFAPEVVADHKNGRGTGLGVFGAERAAEKGRDAKRFKGAWSYPASGKFLVALTASKVKLVIDQSEHVVESMVVVFEIHESGGWKAPRAKLVGGKNSWSGESLCVL